MSGTKQIHPEWSIPNFQKRQIWYAFTCVWILASKSMVAKLKSIEQQRIGRVRYQVEHIDLAMEREMK